MKKFVSLLLAVMFLTGIMPMALASQPFASGTMGSREYRIPAVITLTDGRILAVADMRYDHGTDSPHNIDTLVAIGDGENWDYKVLNHFNDCKDGTTTKKSASFIDSAAIQSPDTGRIFVVTTFFPSGYGSPNAKKGSGFITVDGKRRLALTTGGDSGKIRDYKCYVGNFVDGYAKVFGTGKNYTVDEQYNLYLDGEAIYTKQLNSDELVQQNVFFASSDLHVFPTSYVCLRTSDDMGETWSGITILSAELKGDDEKFFGVCPGKGTVTTVDGKERIMFCMYDNATSSEKTSVVYSDDNGVTWQRSERVKNSLVVGKTSESQIINAPDGSLIMFSRNKSRFVSICRSTNGGSTWTRSKADTDLDCTHNCMVSFINYSAKKIDGKDVVIGSFACGGNDRKDGVIRVGLMDNAGNIEWISKYHINKGFFAYSCLTELSDGTVACLYEDGASKITYRQFNLNDDGTITAQDGNDIQYSANKSIWGKIVDFFVKLFASMDLSC